MPNWCCTNYCFYSDTREGQAHIKELYNKLEKAVAAKYRRVLSSDFGDGWLGNVILSICPQFLKLTETSVTCKYGDVNIPFRGLITDLQFDDDRKVLCIQTETAWEPMTQMWDMILAVCEYSDISYVYVAEEPGDALYINTDTERRFFTDAYYVEIYISDKFYAFESVYLFSSEELLEFENQLIAELRTEYKEHPERYELPKGYTTRGLRKQKTAKAAYSTLEKNLFSTSRGDESYIYVHEYLPS